jgi:hypothetical protein
MGGTTGNTGEQHGRLRRAAHTAPRVRAFRPGEWPGKPGSPIAVPGATTEAAPRYEAFQRGDVAAILDACSDDLDWGAETTSAIAPWYGIRHGKPEVAPPYRRHRALAKRSG